LKKYEGLPREIIALRVSKEIEDNSYVNLGIGIPTLVGNWLEGRDVILQSEIGMLKTGSLAEGSDIDQDLINASCQPVLEVQGTVYFDICESFAMIRGGHVDVTVMGAFQVNESGDFASWMNPSRGLNGVGNIGGCTGTYNTRRRSQDSAYIDVSRDGQERGQQNLYGPGCY
jgi:3-oxoacid CoA-transferase subunit B